MNTFCPECGFGVSVDEEGLCGMCGATAVGSAVDKLVSQQANTADGKNQRSLDCIGIDPEKQSTGKYDSRS